MYLFMLTVNTRIVYCTYYYYISCFPLNFVIMQTLTTNFLSPLPNGKQVDNVIYHYVRYKVTIYLSIHRSSLVSTELHLHANCK